MADNGSGKTLMWLGVLLLGIGVGVALYLACDDPRRTQYRSHWHESSRSFQR